MTTENLIEVKNKAEKAYAAINDMISNYAIEMIDLAYPEHDGEQDAVSIVGHTRNDKDYLISCFESENITIKVHSEGWDNPLLGVEFDDYDTYYRIIPVDTFKTFFNR